MIQVKKKYSGQQSTAALSGQIRLEEGNNRFVVRDSTTGAVITFGETRDGFGAAYYDTSGNLVKTETGTKSTHYSPNGMKVKTETGTLATWYDSGGKVIKVDGIIPGLVDYPVTIIAKPGQDVYTDILGMSAP